MSRRYDSRTTIFSPEGRLYQVEYAMEAISQAGACVGILSKEGVVLAAEKRITSKLLDIREQTEKMYKVDAHISVAVAGITADANILLQYARQFAAKYYYTYQEPIPVEQLLQSICDLKQSYTQFGGLRPFGVSFLFAGYDTVHGFQLYQSDPSGNYGGWKAKAIGSNNAAAQGILKTDYKPELTLDEAQMLAVKVLSKTMDTTSPTPDKMEFSTVTKNAQTGQIEFKIFSKPELQSLLKKAESMLKAEADKQNAGDI